MSASQRERAEFLRQYHEAVDVDHDPAGHQQLRQLLHAWGLTAIAASRDGYYEELAAVQNGTAQTRPAEEVIPGWQERLAAAQAQNAVKYLAELWERVRPAFIV